MSFPIDAPTLVVGHRGSPRAALENTFDSFDTAEAEGADAFELDARLSADGEVVVHHDADVPAGGRTVPIASLPMHEIAALTVSRDGRTGRIPTLRDVFARYGSGGRYLVELKAGPTPKAGLLEFRVAALLVQFALLDRAVVLCFSADLLRRIRDIEPRISTCLNFDATSYRPAGRFWPDLPKGCAAIGPSVSLASDRLLAEAREAGIAVHVWTVNEPDVAGHLAALQVASVITDVPAVVGPAIRAVTGAREPLSV